MQNISEKGFDIFEKHEKCEKIHFVIKKMPNTDMKLGDCSYLDTCRHLESCKYIHYMVDPEDMKRLFYQMTRLVKYPIKSAEEEKRGWTEF